MAQMEEMYDKIAMEVASANMTNENYERLLNITESEQFVENLVRHYGLFFEAVKHQLIQEESHCLSHNSKDQRPGDRTHMFDSRDARVMHQSSYKNLLQWPYPEVYSFDLGWGVEPKRTSILKTLISIP